MRCFEATRDPAAEESGHKHAVYHTYKLIRLQARILDWGEMIGIILHVLWGWVVGWSKFRGM